VVHLEITLDARTRRRALLPVYVRLRLDPDAQPDEGHVRVRALLRGGRCPLCRDHPVHSPQTCPALAWLQHAAVWVA
jgi:hypothetical protein